MGPPVPMGPDRSITLAGDMGLGPNADVLTLRLMAELSYRYPGLWYMVLGGTGGIHATEQGVVSLSLTSAPHALFMKKLL